MERSFPAEEMSDPFWAASSSSSPPLEPISSSTKLISRSQSEWAFQKFLLEAGAESLPKNQSLASTNCVQDDGKEKLGNSAVLLPGSEISEPVQNQLSTPSPVTYYFNFQNFCSF